MSPYEYMIIQISPAEWGEFEKRFMIAANQGFRYRDHVSTQMGTTIFIFERDNRAANGSNRPSMAVEDATKDLTGQFSSGQLARQMPTGKFMLDNLDKANPKGSTQKFMLDDVQEREQRASPTAALDDIMTPESWYLLDVIHRVTYSVGGAKSRPNAEIISRLSTLEKAGLVTFTEQSAGEKLYIATDKGRKALDDHRRKTGG